MFMSQSATELFAKEKPMLASIKSKAKILIFSLLGSIFNKRCATPAIFFANYWIILKLTFIFVNAV